MIFGPDFGVVERVEIEFGVLIVAGLLLIAASIVISLIFVWLPDEVQTYISSVVSNTLLIPFGAIAVTLMYYKLARADVGVEPEPTVPAAPGPPRIRG